MTRSTSARLGLALRASPDLLLLNANQVTGGVPNGSVSSPPRTGGGLLEHLDPGDRRNLGERRIEVLAPQMDRAQFTLGKQRCQSIPVPSGAAGMRLRQNNGDVGLTAASKCDPAEVTVAYVLAHSQTECVAIEAECCVRIVYQDVDSA